MTGEKLRGRLVLVRRDRDGAAGKEQWLLLHKHDEYAVAGWDPEDHPRSVLSGRTNDEVQGRPGPDVALGPAARAGVGRAEAAGRRGRPPTDELAALDALRRRRHVGRSSAASCG